MRRLKVRNWAAVLLSVSLLGGCAGGGAKKPEAVSLYDKGISILEKMDAMAESEAYCQLMTDSPEVLEIIKEIGAGSYSEPKAVYEVKLAQDVMETFQELSGNSALSLEEIPEELQMGLRRRLLESVPVFISSRSGTAVLAAVSLILGEDYFIDNGLSEDVLYFYVYEGGYCGAVTFSLHEEGIVAASGKFVASGDYGQEWGKEEFEEALGMFGGSLGVEVREVDR